MIDKKVDNRYRVIEKLGEGGMGIVWKVFDEVEEKLVALKEIKFKKFQEEEGSSSHIIINTPSALTSLTQIRFAEEFYTMKKLQFPYIVQVYDYGKLEDDNYYITMEYMQGTELRDEILKNGLDFQEIIKILIQLSHTLNFIHSRLYVHRDIKSSNVIVIENRDIKLMDFGLMDIIGITSNGEISGTIDYLPPEVPKGGVVDARSDLYSLGCLAYEMIARQTPFKGNNPLDIIKKHINSEPLPLRKIRQDTPKELEKIVLKLLEKKQDNRYQKESNLIEDLSRLSTYEISIDIEEQQKSYLYCSEIIGRKNEIDKLNDLVRKIAEGAGRSVFIGAPAGVGKTRLIEEVKINVQLSNILFLEGYCRPGEMLPYEPLKQCLKYLLPLSDKEIVTKYASVIVKILPELEKLGFVPEPELNDATSEKIRIIESVVGWICEVAKEKPIVICIDDMHWIDASSMQLINTLIRNVDQASLMFIGAFRDDELDEMTQVLRTVEEEISDLIKLSMLNKECVEELIKAMLGQIELSQDFINQVYDITGGNPFFVTETMRNLIEREQLELKHGFWIVPEHIKHIEFASSIEETITRRLRLLSKDAFEFIKLAALIGKQIDLLMLKAIIKWESNESIFKTLDELIERQFIAKENKIFFFTHDRIRETLTSLIDDDEKKKMHGIIGNTLEMMSISDISSVLNRLAYHFRNSNYYEKSIKYLKMSANNFLLKGAYIEAAYNNLYLETILNKNDCEYPLKNQVLVEIMPQIVQALFSHDPQKAIDIGEKFVELCNMEYNIQKKVKRTRMIFRMIKMFSKRLVEKIKLISEKKIYSDSNKKDKTVEEVTFIKLIRSLIVVHNTEIIANTFLDNFKEAFRIAERMKKYLPLYDSYDAVLARSFGKGVTLGRLGRYNERISSLKTALERCEYYSKYYPMDEKACNRQFWFLYASACYGLLSSVAWISRHNKFQNIYDKAIAITKKYGFYELIGYIYWTYFQSATYDGRYQDIQSLLPEFWDLMKKTGMPDDLKSHIYSVMIHVNLERGDIQQAEKYYNFRKNINKRIRQTYRINIDSILKARILSVQGRINEAKDMLNMVIDSCMNKDNMEPLFIAKIRLAEVIMKEGNIDESFKLAKECFNRFNTEKYENPYGQMNTYRLLGVLLIKTGEYEEAMRILENGLSICRKYENTIQEGFTLVALGKLYSKLTQFLKSEEILKKAKLKFEQIDNKYQLEIVNNYINEIRDNKN